MRYSPDVLLSYYTAALNDISDNDCQHQNHNVSNEVKELLELHTGGENEFTENKLETYLNHLYIKFFINHFTNSAYILALEHIKNSCKKGDTRITSLDQEGVWKEIFKRTIVYTRRYRQEYYITKQSNIKLFNIAHSLKYLVSLGFEYDFIDYNLKIIDKKNLLNFYLETYIREYGPLNFIDSLISLAKSNSQQHLGTQRPLFIYNISLSHSSSPAIPYGFLFNYALRILNSTNLKKCSKKKY